MDQITMLMVVLNVLLYEYWWATVTLLLTLVVMIWSTIIFKNLWSVLLSGFGGELRQACTFLSHMYLTQFFFHLVLCVFMFATWPQHTFFWYILWMNACVCFVQFFHIFVYNSWYYKGIDGAFVPREMVLKDHVKRQILYWALFGIYFTIFLFNTFPWYAKLVYERVFDRVLERMDVDMYKDPPGKTVILDFHGEDEEPPEDFVPIPLEEYQRQRRNYMF